MDGYIEREATLREIERRESLMVGDKTISVDALKRFLLNRPAADVAPVVHGRWEVRGQEVFCTNCDRESGYNAFGASAFSDYCPNCGAKMDGGANNEAD